MAGKFFISSFKQNNSLNRLSITIFILSPDCYLYKTGLASSKNICQIIYLTELINANLEKVIICNLQK